MFTYYIKIILKDIYIYTYIYIYIYINIYILYLMLYRHYMTQTREHILFDMKCTLLIENQRVLSRR